MNAARILLVLALSVPGPVWPATACEWSQYGNGVAHLFAQHDACSSITPANAPTLLPKWIFRVADSVTASPSVSDGVVYVGDWTGRFWAIDAETGIERWHYDIDDPNEVAFGRIVSSAAITTVNGTKVVIFGGGATLYMLRASDGVKLASLCVDPRSIAGRCQGSTTDNEIESSPAVLQRNGETWIVVGHDVHNRAGVGRTGVIAARLRSNPWALDVLWKFDPETLQTYTGADALTRGSGEGHGCGGVWSSPAVDVEADRAFFGTSSCSVDAPEGGESMFGIRLSDGTFVWQVSPVTDALGVSHKRLDDDFGASPNLLPNGSVGFGGKNGWYYARSRATGAPVWANRAGQAGHLTTDFAFGGMIGSAAVGAVNGEPAVFATTALSTPIDRPVDEGDPSRWPDPTLGDDPGRMFSLHAMSAIDGRLLWRTPISRQAYGAPTYARGVLVVPSTFDLTIKAFDANTGGVLWQAPLLGASSSAPAIVGDSIYLGTGTRTSDVEYKALGGESLAEMLGSASPLSPASSVTAFRVAY